MEINANRQNQALGILTIGTAALGVGLFQVEFEIGFVFFDFWSNVPLDNSVLLAVAKLACVGVVIGNYVAMFGSVARILSQTDYVTGRQLADGPLVHLGLEIWFLILVFVTDVIQGSVTNSQ